jgi:hypothetical protein
MGFPLGQVMQIVEYVGGSDGVQNVTVVCKNTSASANE